MKKHLLILALSLIYSLSLLIPPKTLASDLGNTTFRLDRNTPNIPLSGLICASPSDGNAGIENRLNVEFPSDFTINSNASNWNVDTSDIPDNSLPWPGIGFTAYSITNNTVTFSSGNLTNSSNLYCFNFSSSSSKTSGSVGNKTGVISTRNSLDQEIDHRAYGLTILNNDQITVTASVPPKPSDYNTQITNLNAPEESIYSEGQEVEYALTYGTTLPFATSFTVEAHWSQGTIDGESNESLNVLEYVPESATTGYGGAIPVIDTIHKTITWNVNSFPANTSDEIVNFKLKTLGNYGEPKKVFFRTSSRILFADSSTVYSYHYATYKHSTGPIISPTPIPPFIPPVISPNFENIKVTEITQDQAKIYTQTNVRTNKVIRYGTSMFKLNQSSSTNLSNTTNFVLKKLKPSTKYYFRIYATDKNNKQIISDIYTFTTASISTPLTANTTSLIATSGNTIISSLNPVSSNILVIPIESVFQFKFAMLNKISANATQAFIRNERILGEYSFTKKAEASTDSTNLIEIENGVYSGNLQTNSLPGDYGLYVRINDQNGNLSEQKLTNIKVVNKFKVVSEKNKPVEGARVLLFALNPNSKTFEMIPSSSITNGNPLFTDYNGELSLALPVGKYKAEVSDLRHKDTSVEFTIGPNQNHGFPTVKLENSNLTLLGLVSYYRRTLNDVFLYNTQAYYESLTGSSRFFDLISMISLFGIAILTIFAFSRRHRIPVSYIPSYFYYLIDKKDRNDKYIHGVIYDEKDKPIPGANVYLTDKKDEKIIGNTKTNSNGEFYFKKGKSDYVLMAMAKNYISSPLFDYHEREHLKFKIILRKEEKGLNLYHQLIHYFNHLVGISFEALLLISFFFELLFLNSFGLARTIPFLLISIFNLALWILHLHNKSHTKTVF